MCWLVLILFGWGLQGVPALALDSGPLVALTAEWQVRERPSNDVPPGWALPGFDFAPGPASWPTIRVVTSTSPRPAIALTNDFTPNGVGLVKSAISLASVHYLRTSFLVTNAPASPVDLMVSHLSSDGAVFYLNGAEIGRWNMPAGLVESNTVALKPPSAARVRRFVVHSTTLLAGTNTFAASLHSSSVAQPPTGTCLGATLDVLPADYLVFGESFTNSVVFEGQPLIRATSFEGGGGSTLQWYHNDELIPFAAGPSLERTSVTAQDAGSYALVARAPSGRSATNRFQVIVLSSQLIGSLDGSFHSLPIVYDVVRACVVQSDDRVLVGGRFGALPGSTGVGILRLNPDGTVDSSFNGPNLQSSVFSLLLQPDGRVIVGGSFAFTNPAGSFTGLIRLMPDGTPDASFVASATAGGGRVLAMQGAPGGQIYVGGEFRIVNGMRVPGVARLNGDGTLDSSFNPQIPPSNVRSLLVQPDGRLLVGHFTGETSPATSNILHRLLMDGSVDPSFRPTLGPLLSAPASEYVAALALDDALKIYAAGKFRTYGGVVRTNVVRMASDGSIDPDFNAGLGQDAFTYQIIPLTDGGILLAGDLSAFDGKSAGGIVRLRRNGSTDSSFILSSALMSGAAAPPAIYGASFLGDGRLVLGGVLRSYLGLPVSDVIRVHLPVDPPQVRVDAPPEGGLLFSWPVAGGAFRLETTAEIPDGHWGPVDGLPHALGGRWFLNRMLGGGDGFFRVTKP